MRSGPSFDSEGCRPSRPMRLLQILLAILLCLSAAMCASSESHIGETKLFLNACDADNPCLAPGQDCYCVCTIPCATNATCRKELEGIGLDTDRIVCRAPVCGAASEDDAAVCDVTCDTTEDCAPLSPNHVCDEGYCRAPAGGKANASTTPADPRCPSGGVFLDATSGPLCLSETEVTVLAYTECATAGDCTEPTLGNFFTTGRENYPINAVTPEQATTYCASIGGRLPTKDEFAFAATNGGTTDYPWDSTVPASGDNLVCALGTTDTCEVGSFAAGDSDAKLSDLVGNVAEYATDGAGYCLAGGYYADTDPANLLGSACVTFDEADLSEPAFELSQLGFRCAFPAE